ncbi:MAG TPA: hypothetical protein VNZ22_17335, partial [Bacillota bacterium]|nr:hypothetical protein [Bacillota bacterium]
STASIPHASSFRALSTPSRSSQNWLPCLRVDSTPAFPPIHFAICVPGQSDAAALITLFAV